MKKLLLLVLFMPACIIAPMEGLESGNYTIDATYYSGDGMCAPSKYVVETISYKHKQTDEYISSIDIVISFSDYQVVNNIDCEVSITETITADLTSHSSFTGLEQKTIRSLNCPSIDCDSTYTVNAIRE